MSLIATGHKVPTTDSAPNATAKSLSSAIEELILVVKVGLFSSIERVSELYFAFEAGSYLLCVSSTRNERLDYNLGVVAEIASGDLFLLTEDTAGGFLLFEPDQENEILLDTGPEFNANLYHDHSVTEWTKAWQRERSPGDALPEIFIPLSPITAFMPFGILLIKSPKSPAKNGPS